MQSVIAPRTTPLARPALLAAILAIVGIPLTLVLTFWWAPVATIALDTAGHDIQRDLPQKIFYLHVPIAFAAYLGFFVGAWNGLLHLLRGDAEYDLRSYVGIHVALVFGTLVLITGSIWARASWGTWWNWGDRQLLVFLILYLYYAAYFMLRFSIDSPAARARASSVYAVVGVVLVPISFLAIRIADTLIHPIVIDRHGLRMTHEMGITFLIGSIAMLGLATWMMQLEATVKIRALRIRRAAERSRPPAATVTVRPTTRSTQPAAKDPVDG